VPATLRSAAIRAALEPLALYLRHAPWEKGRWRIVNLATRLSPALVDQKHSRTITSRYGFRIRTNGQSQAARMIFLTGEYEPATAHLAQQLVTAGDVVVDVGAHIGCFALMAAAAVGSRGLVIAFEPFAASRLELLQNIALNGFANVTVRPEAACEGGTRATLFEGPSGDSGLASLRNLQANGRRVSVPACKLDALLTADRKVSLVKIDVEGAELRVLRGMEAVLDRDRPDLIVEVTESFLQAFDDSCDTMRRWLARFGYRMYAIESAGLVPLDDDTKTFTAGQFNALFTARPALPPSISLTPPPAPA
jgi:FkbM family methyltransferase